VPRYPAAGGVVADLVEERRLVWQPGRFWGAVHFDADVQCAEVVAEDVEGEFYIHYWETPFGLLRGDFADVE